MPSCAVTASKPSISNLSRSAVTISWSSSTIKIFFFINERRDQGVPHLYSWRDVMEQRKCQLPSCHEKLFYDDKPIFPHNKKSAKYKTGGAQTVSVPILRH